MVVVTALKVDVDSEIVHVEEIETLDAIKRKNAMAEEEELNRVLMGKRNKQKIDVLKNRHLNHILKVSKKHPT